MQRHTERLRSREVGDPSLMNADDYCLRSFRVGLETVASREDSL